MAEWRFFICKEGSSNKYWKFRYTKGGCSVEKRWGRVGGHESEQTKDFPSPSRASAYAEKEVGEKLRKGYTEQTEETLHEETKVAQAIGTQWKIDKLEFLGQDWEPGKSSYELSTSEEYLPECGVYVEMLQSWSKEKTFLLITKKTAVQFGAGKSNGTVRVSSPQYHVDSGFVEGVRLAIRNLYKAVEAVTVQFAALGIRNLDLDDIGGGVATQPAEAVAAFKAVASKAGVSNQVVEKFASLGSRVLEI